MKSVFRIAAIILTAGIITVSCAESPEDESYDNKEQRSLDTWMSLYINNNGEVAERLDNGMYIEWLEHGENGAAQPVTDNWLQLNYIGRTLQNEIFLTREEGIAREEGTFSAYTHYDPHFVQYSEAMGLTQAQITALGMMKKGDKVRIYAPSKVGMTTNYSMPVSYGYGGHMSVTYSTPVVIDMELVDIIDNPEQREKRMIAAWARDYMGLENIPAIADTTLYFKMISPDPSNLDIERDTVKVDEAIKINYVGRFTDGFLFDTNIPTVAAAAGRDTTVNSTNYVPISFTPQNGSLVDAFLKVIEAGEVFYDSKFQMVFTSTLGYDVTGQTGSESSTFIQPYTPLFFEVTVLPKEEEDEDEDEG